eukprot:9570711-Alexandrium_andersonii.AAC.1
MELRQGMLTSKGIEGSSKPNMFSCIGVVPHFSIIDDGVLSTLPVTSTPTHASRVHGHNHNPRH